jgi:hypothetical protein
MPLNLSDETDVLRFQPFCFDGHRDVCPNALEQPVERAVFNLKGGRLDAGSVDVDWHEAFAPQCTNLLANHRAGIEFYAVNVHFSVS